MLKVIALLVHVASTDWWWVGEFLCSFHASPFATPIAVTWHLRRGSTGIDGQQPNNLRLDLHAKLHKNPGFVQYLAREISSKQLAKFGGSKSSCFCHDFFWGNGEALHCERPGLLQLVVDWLASQPSVHFRNLIWFDVCFDLQPFPPWCFTSRGIQKIRSLSIHVSSFPPIPSCVCASRDSGCWRSGPGCAEGSSVASSAKSNWTPHQQHKIPEVKNIQKSTICTPPVSYDVHIIVAHVHDFFFLG